MFNFVHNYELTSITKTTNYENKFSSYVRAWIHPLVCELTCWKCWNFIAYR